MVMWYWIVAAGVVGFVMGAFGISLCVMSTHNDFESELQYWQNKCFELEKKMKKVEKYVDDNSGGKG